jgi:hypothetical protein
VVSCMAVVALAAESPDLPSGFTTLAGTPAGYRRVVGSEEACPDSFQISDKWDKVDSSGGPMLGEIQVLATHFNFVNFDSTNGGSCGVITIHEPPSHVHSATIFEPISKIFEGKIYFSSMEDACKISMSPRQIDVSSPKPSEYNLKVSFLRDSRFRSTGSLAQCY